MGKISESKGIDRHNPCYKNMTSFIRPWVNLSKEKKSRIKMFTKSITFRQPCALVRPRTVSDNLVGTL